MVFGEGSLFIVNYLSIEAPTDIKNNGNWKISKTNYFYQVIIVTRLHSPKIIVINLRGPCECWRLRSENSQISWFWTHFDHFLWYAWQNSMDFRWFLDFLPTLEGSFSTITDPISKSLGIFNKYSPRAVDCAMFRRRATKTTFYFWWWKIEIFRFWLCHPQHRGCSVLLQRLY